MAHAFCLLLFLLFAASLIRATTVQPPTFPELVDEADAIYRGRVISVQPRHVATPDGSVVIKTFVTFVVENALKGSDRDEVVLEFLGGTIGDESLEVGSMPHFQVGQREIIFVQKNGMQFCPLVRLGHGRYRVEHDTATDTDYIARDNRTPLAATAEVALPLDHDAHPTTAPTRAAAVRDPSTALRADEFISEIRAEVQRASLRAPSP